MWSEEDTFDKLRRIDYNTACVEYFKAIIHMGCCESMEVRRRVADPILKPLGWTVDELLEIDYPFGETFRLDFNE